MAPRRGSQEISLRSARSLLYDEIETVAPARRRPLIEARTVIDTPEDPATGEADWAPMLAEREVDALGLEEVEEQPEQPERPSLSLSEQAAVLRPPARRPPPASRSVLSRVFKSVVTAIPGALKTLVGIEPQPKGAAGAGSAEALWRQLRTVAILDGVPNHALADALDAGELALVEAGRDDLIDIEGRALLVKQGQVALARFEPGKLAAERKAQGARKPPGQDKKADKKEHKRRQEAGPLIEMAARNLAFFEEGDLVELKPPGSESDGAAYACYAVTPAVLISLTRARIDEWKLDHPFLGDRFRRASQAARQRIDAVVGAREEVADFFIRHGLSIAQTLRVRQIDKCVECGACEAACEERYGAKRLSLNGRVLGGLDFVDACHTCTDQRCIDPCAFDAIKYDQERCEIVIVEAACTGCTLCASACPYDAIEMHDLEDKPLLALRLEKEGALAFGEGTARKAKLKRMASKCDHCVSYGDQACISACPTGALFEVAPADVFHARPEALRDSARAGYDQSVFIDLNQMHDPRIFAKGLDARIDRSRARKPQIWTTWMWVVGLGAWLMTVAEILARKLSPEHSIDYLYQTLVDGIDPEIVLSRIDYRPGCELAVRLGYIGAIIMFSGMLYPARRRLPFMRHLGSQRAWFEMHVLTGVVGPLFVLLHSAVKLDNWVSLAFWSMVGTVLSGLMGRYLTTQLPERASSATLDMLEVDRTLNALRARHPSLRAADDWYAFYQGRVSEAARRGPLGVLAWLIADDLSRPTRRAQLVRELDRVPDAYTRGEAARCVAKLALYERRRVLLPKLEPLFKRWKLVHVPMAITLTVVGTIHIVLSILRG